MGKDIKQKPSKQDRRLSDLESRASLSEQKAEYAEKEAELRKRIREAEDRVRACRPQSAFDFSLLGGLWAKMPGPARFMLVVVTLIVSLLVIAKSCTGSG